MDKRSRPGISVALATYNGARFLDEQLRSIAEQTLLPAELVVSDDGSTDGTIEMVRRFADRAPFSVRLLDNSGRLGFADNFLHAAQACRGDLVAFCDQDDVWLPRKLEIGGARIVADDSLLSLHPLTVTDEALRPLRVHDQGIGGDAVFEPLALDPLAGWGNTMVFRRELVHLVARERRPGQPGEARPLSHDSWIYALAAALGRVSHIAEPLILYRQHGENAAGLAARSWRERLAGMVADQTRGFRRKAALDGALAVLFGELADGSDGDLRRRATAAADCYLARGKRLDDRIAVYESPSASRRISAYRAMVRSLHADPAARTGRIAAKDLLLGVSGLARLIARPDAA